MATQSLWSRPKLHQINVFRQKTPNLQTKFVWIRGSCHQLEGKFGDARKSLTRVPMCTMCTAYNDIGYYDISVIATQSLRYRPKRHQINVFSYQI